MELWAQSVPYKLMDEYKILLKTKVFKDWSDASYERMEASHIARRLATDEVKAWLVTKIEMWERWLNAGKVREVKLGSFSWKMKGCEPISDNQLRWITLKTQILDLTRKIRQGSYGSVYLVGFRDVALGLELGMEGVVPYVAKKCEEKPPYNAWVMIHKELASFAETHCAIVWPIACHNIEAEPILFMHDHDWLHCDIHVLNVFLHFPDWDYEDGQEEHRMPTWDDERSLVFAALGDLGMAQQVHVAASDNGRKYPRVPKKERDWIATELVDSKINKLAPEIFTSIQSTSTTKQLTCMLWACLPIRFVGTPHKPDGRPTETPSQQRSERTNVYEDYLNAERVNMAYGMAYHEMRQLGLLLPEQP
ncbi:hypothetical protein R1sor_026479 [Riccia sorocarpa]|uniref:Protein kinase domain-containing protein n=1 Tax=Riccia sorocarpa TaxID=122646 RepID=A0ABD3GD60_9MARC